MALVGSTFPAALVTEFFYSAPLAGAIGIQTAADLRGADRANVPHLGNLRISPKIIAELWNFAIPESVKDSPLDALIVKRRRKQLGTTSREVELRIEALYDK
jgi:hypothetical protein